MAPRGPRLLDAMIVVGAMAIVLAQIRGEYFLLWLHVWFSHCVVWATLSAPIVLFGRERVRWNFSDLLAFLIPFGIWLALMNHSDEGKSLSNLAEAFYFSFAIPVAALIRVVVGGRFDERVCSITLVGILSLVAAGVYRWMPAPSHARGVPPIRRPVLEPQVRSPTEEPLARAYDRAVVPRFAERDSVELSVVDDETSRHIAEADVRISNQIDFRTHVLRTGPRGRLRVEYPSLHGKPLLNVEVRKDGYVPVGHGWGFEGSPGPPESWTFRLRRGTTMGGIVVAEAERPVEGVTVLLTVTRYGAGARPANSTASEYYRDIPSRTGPDGRWRTDSVPPGADGVKLRLIHPDFVSDGMPSRDSPARSPRTAALREQSDRQVLLRGSVLKGRVIDEMGRPIGGTRIDDATRLFGSSEPYWCRISDAKGNFSIHLPRGKSFLLTAAAAGFAPGMQVVTPDADQPIITFQLSRGKALRGRVVDPAGHPIEGVRVYGEILLATTPLTFHAWTNEEGQFEWTDAPAEAVDFRFAAQGFIDDDRTHLLTAGDGVAEITLRPAVDFQIVAIDAQTREAIPRFRIQIGTHDPATNDWRWGPRMGRSPPKGFQILLEAERGPYQFQVSADGYLPARILVPRERTVMRGVIPLEKAAR